MFSEKVFSKLNQIPKGKITTYKALAEALGTKAYRAVGNALNKNKHPDSIPCFKVVNSDGTLGGFALGPEEKIRRLKEEDIEVKDNKILDFEKKLHKF